MQTSTNSIDRIVAEACRVIGEAGLGALTVGTVAERAGVSSALVHYHFDTKARLVVASAERIAEVRTLRRGSALDAASGLAALDELWRALTEGIDDGVERAWLELVLQARADAEVAAVLATPRSAARDAMARRLPQLMRELGATLPASAEEMAAALEAQLDGLALALLGGQEPGSVRSAYDAFWLTLLAAGPSRRR